MTEPPETARPSPLARLKGLVLKPAIRNRVLAPMAFDATILAANLFTGVVVARLLGPQGRGELAVILMLAQTATWIFSMGASEAISFRISREPGVASKLLGGWLAVSVPLALLAIGITELALPTLFGAQTDEAVEYARIFIVMVIPIMGLGIFNGFLLGDEEFLWYNITRLLAPVCIAAGYLTIWLVHDFTVEIALLINSGATLIMLSVAIWRVLRRHRIGRPDRKLTRESVWYGLRAHAGSLAGIVNARLDLLIIPAFLGAASIGLYSVATNTTSIISTMTSTVAIFVLPVAARKKNQSPRTVIRTFQAVLGISAAFALPLAVLAEPALELVYGSEFGGAATAMRILLPGVVIDAAAVVLWSGLLAANRPFLASVADVPAGIITVGGLLIFLRSGGIEVAAIVTTVAYTVTAVISVFLYKRVAKLRWRDFVHPPADPTPAASEPAPGA